jgi:hypothetical protein
MRLIKKRKIKFSKIKIKLIKIRILLPLILIMVEVNKAELGHNKVHKINLKMEMAIL